MRQVLNVALFLSLPLWLVGARADDGADDLAELPVASMQTVAADDYRDAEALAARGASPVDIALAVAGAFEGAVQQIVQVNEGSEAPAASSVTVLRDGLLDDSLRGRRWDVSLARTDAGTWSIREVRRAWRCWRGPNTNRYAIELCP